MDWTVWRCEKHQNLQKFVPAPLLYCRQNHDHKQHYQRTHTCTYTHMHTGGVSEYTKGLYIYFVTPWLPPTALLAALFTFSQPDSNSMFLSVAAASYCAAILPPCSRHIHISSIRSRLYGYTALMSCLHYISCNRIISCSLAAKEFSKCGTTV